MSLRRHANPDSLELLLDTMCNTFGGIIMIALLIALLSRDTTQDSGSNNRAAALETQTVRLRQQLQEAQKLQGELTQQVADPKTTATLRLLTEREQLRREVQNLTAAAVSNLTFSATLATNGTPTADELRVRRQEQLGEVQSLNQEIARELQSRQRAVRLPRERVTGKKTFYFIVRHNRVYPIHFMSNGQRQLNDQWIDWRTVANGETATPRPLFGFDARAGLPAFARFLNEVPNATYTLHFLVYDDSVPGFIAARQIPVQRGYDAGWEFLTQEKPVIFSSRGEAPPAL